MTNFLFLALLFSSLLFSACGEQKPKKQSKAKEIEKPKIKQNTISKDTFTLSSNKQTEVETPIQKKPQQTVKPKKVAEKKIELTATPPAELEIPTKWKSAYSNSPKWMSLYSSSQNSFLKGWQNEFELKPSIRISKDELLQAYRSRMETVFYETPSFIEFCVQEMKVSTEFELFCETWKKNVI